MNMHNSPGLDEPVMKPVLFAYGWLTYVMFSFYSHLTWPLASTLWLKS